MNMLMPRLPALLLVALLAAPGAAEDWPGWLGPRRDGSSSEKIKPWKGDLKVAWKADVGPGHSSPVMSGGKAYLFTRTPGKEAEELVAFDAVTGKKLWTKGYPRSLFWSPFGTGPQGTPQVANGKVFTFGATGILTAFDASSGEILWKVDAQKEFKSPGLFFGAACSPLVIGDKVIVNVGGKLGSVVAFSADKGEVVWKSLDDRASYSSGIAMGSPDKREAVFLTQQGLRGLNAANGKKVWDFPLVDKLNESSTTPVVAGDLLLASSINFGMVGLKLDRGGDGTTVKQVWKNQKLTCYFSTPIPVGKQHVYVVTGTLSFKPISALHCIETETGKVLWTKDNVGKYHAAMLRTADDKLLMLSDLGDLVLFEPDPTGFKELARSKVVKKEAIWAHPALSNGRVYFRDEKELICLEMPE